MIPHLTPPKTKELRSLIWNYYRVSGRKLPWRETQDPYAILVSEIMLQQTQVARVLTKYKEFLKKFSSFRALARAPIASVLAAWQGLGYNRRALSLKKIAEIVVRDHAGKLPRDFDALLALPGIGPGTAGSLSAFVFDLPVYFIETNIRRVYIHSFFPNRREVTDDMIMPLVAKTLDRQNPREWYYALMDYGAMLGRVEKLENPNRRSAHYQVQSKFKGSKRELRGKVLREVLTAGSISQRNIGERLGKSDVVLDEVISTLIKEGFIKRRKGKLSLSE